MSKIEEDLLMNSERTQVENYSHIIRAAELIGKVKLGDLYQWYQAMQSPMHEGGRDKTIIDIGSLEYILQRSVFEITRADKIYFNTRSEDLTTFKGIRLLTSEARRRTIYEVEPGCLLGIPRESLSDMSDFLTNTIIFGIEAEKISKRLRDYELPDNFDSMVEEERNQEIVKISCELGIQAQQVAALDKATKGRLGELISNIRTHDYREMQLKFSEEFKKTDYPYNAIQWRKNIERYIENDNRPIILISSDKHIVRDSLTDFIETHKDKIIEESKRYDDLRDIEPKDRIALGHLAFELSKKDTSFGDLKFDYERNYGIQYITDEHNTGIDAQVIDIRKLDFDKIDHEINILDKEALLDRAPIILNIDYAFGKQGTDIMRELCQTYNKRIESISVEGKAAIFCGERFDVMIPTYIVEYQRDKAPIDFPNNDRKNWLQKDDIRFPQGDVHDQGPFLTVSGVHEQSRISTDYFIREFKILGLEMESAKYLAAINRAFKRGLLCPDIMINFGYWGSDNPHNKEEDLSKGHMAKGAYSGSALVLSILSKTFNEGSACYNGCKR